MVVYCFHRKKRKTKQLEKIQSLDCNLKRGLKALKTLSFICSGQWKVENRVLVMFSLERRNFNGQFFTFLRGAKISSEDFNTPKNIEVTDNDDVDNDDGDDDDYNEMMVIVIMMVMRMMLQMMTLMVMMMMMLIWMMMIMLLLQRA